MRIHILIELATKTKRGLYNFIMQMWSVDVSASIARRHYHLSD